MKEIKFRAYCETHKYMYDVCSMTFLGNKVSVNDNSACIGKEILMQYTGLKDMNYKEIYVGDIVEINSHKYTIKFEIGSFMLVRCSDETDMYEQFENCWCDDVYPLAQFHWESNDEEDVLANCEVIGNKYENPALLEG